MDSLAYAISKIIFSASGWRGVFALNGNDESKEEQISPFHRAIAALSARVFVEFIKKKAFLNGKIIIGRDTRPTGSAITDAVIRMLIALDIEIFYIGISAAPEIMALAAREKETSGFIYISASHNPIGHNGLKFGLNDGGVIQAEENALILSAFNEHTGLDNWDKILLSILESIDKAKVDNIYNSVKQNKALALKVYRDFTLELISNSQDKNKAEIFLHNLQDALKRKKIGFAVDFNGSARSMSIDRDFFTSLGIDFKAINDKPGEIVHRIVPEGISLEPCRLFLDELNKRDPKFIMGYLPDCDGDRGNLVISSGETRILDAQEVFALACLAEFAFLYKTGELRGKKTAVVLNDPSSLRVDKIAAVYGIDVFRAEVGEANVVGLARKLRNESYTVKILGEGSSGGTIIYPASVRDPLNTITSILKLLLIDDEDENNPGLFKKWCELSGQKEKFNKNFTLEDIINTLPVYHSTGAYTEEAVLNIKTEDHALLKERYQDIFLREWEKNSLILNEKYAIARWQAISYIGMNENRNINSFGEAKRGGLKIEFFKNDYDTLASSYIWMRGSGTEKVFRIMADSDDLELYNFLINWQRQMVLEADKNTI